MAYKFPKKLSFTTRTLINLEENTGKGIAEIFSELEAFKFTSMMELVAAGANLTLDEAVDLIDQEFEKGLTFEILAEVLEKSVSNSSFLKNPAVQKALSEDKKPKAKETTAA